jgi:hypothetical protein
MAERLGYGGGKVFKNLISAGVRSSGAEEPDPILRHGKKQVEVLVLSANAIPLLAWRTRNQVL